MFFLIASQFSLQDATVGAKTVFGKSSSRLMMSSTTSSATKCAFLPFFLNGSAFIVLSMRFCMRLNVKRLSLDETRGRRKYIIIHTMVVKRAVAATVPNSSGDAGANKSEGNDFDLNMLPLLIVIVSLGYLRSLSVHKLFSRCVVLCVDVVECCGSPFVKIFMSMDCSRAHR